MVIYHLAGHVYINEFGDLCRRHSAFSEVYSSLELAVQAGTEIIRERIGRLQKEDTCYADMAQGVFVNEKIEYSFTVCEFDPVRREQDIRRTDGENITLANSVEFADRIEWEFDSEGKLLRRFEWTSAGYEVHPGDYAEHAGTLFEKGDLVTIKPGGKWEKWHDQEVYVVWGTPGRRQEWHKPLCWENLYALYYLSYGEGYVEPGHDHVHESLLEPYQGELPEESYLRRVSEIFKGERIVGKETEELLYSSNRSDLRDWKKHFCV